MVRYLIISTCGLGLFMASRLAKSTDVEKVYFWTPDPDMKLGKDLQEVSGWEKLEILKDFAHALNHIEKNETPFDKHTTNTKDDLIIVFDDNGYGELADYLKNEEYKVIGGGRFDDRMESDRTYAADFMKKFMDVPETYTFESFKEGLAFLKGQPKEIKFVFKPHNNEVPKEMTYVSKDVPDLVSAIERFKTNWEWEEKFQLQVFIEGIEVDFNAYFNGKEWMDNSLMIYFENKPLGNDDKGPATGGAIAVQIARPLRGPFFDILDKVKPYLEKVKFRGCFAINSIISEKDKKPYFLELTPRFGYPSLPLDITMLEDNGKSLHSFFTAMLANETTSFFPTDKVAVTVSIFSMPFPDIGSETKKERKGISLSWDSLYDQYFFPYYIMGKKGKTVLSGDSGWVLQITCIGSTLDGTVNIMYDKYIPSLSLQNAFFRTDAGSDAKKRMQKLREWGIL